MQNVLYAIAVLGGMGAIFGLVLAIASKVFAVKTDARLEPLIEALPGANCGGCGYSGCAGYAQAVLEGKARIGKCAAGGKECADAMAKIRDLFPNTMAVDYNNVTLAMRRERIRAAVDPDEIDTVELFEKFYEEQVEKPVDDVQHEIVTKLVRAAEEAGSRGLDGKGSAR